MLLIWHERTTDTDLDFLVFVDDPLFVNVIPSSKPQHGITAVPKLDRHVWMQHIPFASTEILSTAIGWQTALPEQISVHFYGKSN